MGVIENTAHLAPENDYESEWRRLPFDLRLRDEDTNEDISPFPVKVCHSPKLREFERPEVDGASVVDGSHYMATLCTGPSFGCIHHEALS